MTKPAKGVAAILGTIDFIDQHGTMRKTLNEAVGSLQYRSVPITVPHAGSKIVQIDLPAGVDEVLFLYASSPRELSLQLTGKAPTPGPIVFGVKGVQMLTFAPGKGITALTFTNADPTQDAEVDLVLGCKANATDDTPAYWT